MSAAVPDVGRAVADVDRAAVLDAVVGDPAVAGAPADRAAVRRAVARTLAARGVVLPPGAWAATVRDLVDDVAGLGPLEHLLRDPAVTDVCCNGPDEVLVERGGRLAPAGVRFRDRDHLERTIRRVLASVGVRLDHAHPWADAVLPGGVRVHAVLPPLAAVPCLTLRRVALHVPTWPELVADGTCDQATAARLRDLVRQRANVVVAGGAGVGKTTLLRRLLQDVDGDRVVVIEDTPELDPPRGGVALRTRQATPDGVGAVGLDVLLRNALRMRPDRLVVGEVRGAEVAEMLQACNTGHAGSLATVHANGAADACVRLHGMALLAGVADAAARAQVSTGLDVVVVLGRGRDGRRRIREVARVVGWRDGRWELRPVGPGDGS